MTEVERNAARSRAPANDVDDIDLDL